MMMMEGDERRGCRCRVMCGFGVGEIRGKSTIWLDEFFMKKKRKN
jgi:hypothetical protein